MLRRYEVMFIAHTDLSDDNLNELIERYETIITQAKGIVVKIDKWGARKLAYEIKKQRKGFYVLMDFAGQSDIVLELERMLKIEDKILKYLTIIKNDNVNLADLEKEIQSNIPTEGKDETPQTNTYAISTAADKMPVTEEKEEETADSAKEEKE
jgi:small subunit ribosomal protein S6